MPVTLQSENLSMSHEYSLATKLDRQIQVIVVKVPLCLVSRVEDRLNLYFNYPEKGSGKNEKTHEPCPLLQHGICHGGGSIMGIKRHLPILRSGKTTYRAQLTVQNEGFFYLSALITVVWIGQFCGTCSNDFNREGLGIEVDFSLPSERVVRALN